METEASAEIEAKSDGMRKDWLIPVAVICAALAVVGWLVMRTGARTEVPMIEGIPVADYTVRLQHAVVGAEIEFLARDRKTALPVLIEQMDVDETRLERFMTRMWKSAPAGIRERFKDRRTAEELRAGASWGLMMLLMDPKDRYTSGPVDPVSAEEAQLLLPAVRGGLSDTNIYVRLNAAVMLGALQVVSAEALELCRMAKEDRHYGVRFNTAHSLARLMTNSPKARVELESMRGDKHPEVREKVAEWLGDKPETPMRSGPGAFE